MAVANAGGPTSYDIAASSGDHSSIGFSQESTQKGFAGQNVISSYTKSDDSAHSFVRVSSQSISNDALLNYDIAHAPLVKTAYSTPAYLAPTAAPLIAKTYAAPYSYSAPLLTKTYTASAPLITKAAAVAAPAPLLHAAPASLLTRYTAPIGTVAPAPLLHATSAEPLIHAAPASFLHAAPAAPLLAKSYGYAAQAPIIAKSALIAPAAGICCLHYTSCSSFGQDLRRCSSCSPSDHQGLRIRSCRPRCTHRFQWFRYQLCLVNF